MSVKKSICIIKNLEKYLPIGLNNLFENAVNILENKGYKIKKINIPKKIRENLQITYLILCSSELVSHLNSLQGITYGIEDKSMSISEKRSKYLGKVVKERLLIGAYFLENPQIIEKAQKMRYLIDKWIKKIFKEGNFLIFPSTSGSAPKYDSLINSDFSGLISSDWADNLLLLANFSGLPSCNLPMGFFNSLPVGININAPYKKDKEVLELAKLLEEELEKNKSYFFGNKNFH